MPPSFSHLSQKILASLKQSGGNLPEWLSEIVLLEHISDLTTSMILNLQWRELALTFQEGMLQITVVRGGDDIEQMGLTQLNQDAVTILQSLQQDHRIDTNTQYVFTPVSRSIINNYLSSLTAIAAELTL